MIEVFHASQLMDATRLLLFWMFHVHTKGLVDLLHAQLVVTLMTHISNQINDMQLSLKKTKIWCKESIKRGNDKNESLKRGE
jgi:hypothetical protein